MSMQMNNKERLAKDLAAHLQDPEFSDVKIICSDGEIPANRSILGMRSEYFRGMFSANNNFVESQAGTVKLPYTKAVMEKVVLYLYSGELDCQELALRPMLDLLELFDLMNLPAEHSTMLEFTQNKILKGKFAFPVCLENLGDSLKLGVETLLTYLGENFLKISKLAEVGGLSEAVVRRLLQEKMNSRETISSQIIPRLDLLTTWLSVNMVEADVKEELLQMLPFDFFTTKQLANEVRKSGLYQTDKIFDRIEQLLEVTDEDAQITPEDISWYGGVLFEELLPSCYGPLSVEKVRNSLPKLHSVVLPDSTKDKIMELSDQDGDGLLDKYEFMAANHLTLQAGFFALQIPNQLPLYLSRDFLSSYEEEPGTKKCQFN